VRARKSFGFPAWLSAAALAFCFGGEAAAQDVCVRLEQELAATERGGSSSSARARVEQAYQRQRYEYDRLVNIGRQYDCGAFGARHPVCQRIDAQLDRTEAALRQLQNQRAQLASDSARADRREAVLDAMDRYGCRRGPPPRTAGGLFAQLFGIPRLAPPPRIQEFDEEDQRERDDPRDRRDPRGFSEDGEAPVSGTFRSLCVRTCDGYYWPISFSTSSRFFERDTKICEASCPGQPVQLYVHRNPGEWSDDAVSLEGKPLAQMPNAFAYRAVFKRECGCGKPNATLLATNAAPPGQGPSTPVAASVPLSEALSAFRSGRSKGAQDPAPAPEAETVPAPPTSAPAAPAQPRFTAPLKTAQPGSGVRVVGPPFLPAQ